MNVLTIATSYGFSKPISGGQNRFSNLVESLKKRGNNIFILESSQNFAQSDCNVAEIFTYKDIKLFSRTLVPFREFNVSFFMAVYKIIKYNQIDIIQITHPSGVLSTKILSKLLMKRTPIVYDAHNVESDFTKNIFCNNPKYSLFERFILPWYIEFLEKLVCKYFADHITSVSDRDMNIFIEKYNIPPQKISTIPSGSCIFDVNPSCKNDIKHNMNIDSNKIVVFFHGLYTHPPNKEAFEIIINIIAPKFEKMAKNVLFVLGGNKLPKFEKENIKSLGFVDDLHSVLSIVDVAIVPLIHGEGTKLKIFDYMMAGLPIVSTKKGLDGIDTENYVDVIAVDNVNDEFINKIKYLIDNEQERKEIGANARLLAKDRYNWDNIGKDLDVLFKKIMKEYSNENH